MKNTTSRSFPILPIKHLSMGRFGLLHSVASMQHYRQAQEVRVGVVRSQAPFRG